MGQQRLGDAGVLGDHRVGGRERRQRAEGNVAQIADWRGDNVQARTNGLGFCPKAEGRESRCRGFGRVHEQAFFKRVL